MTFHIDIERKTFIDAVFQVSVAPARTFAQQDFLCSGPAVTVRQIFARKIREHRNLYIYDIQLYGIVGTCRTFMTLSHTKL